MDFLSVKIVTCAINISKNNLNFHPITTLLFLLPGQLIVEKLEKKAAMALCQHEVSLLGANNPLSIGLKNEPISVLSLASILDADVSNEDSEDEGEDEIPQEEIQQYLQEVSEQREELRRNLRKRFAQLCVNGL